MLVQAKSVEGQIRYAMLGVFKAQNYTVIVTYRGAIIRIISARLSTPNEIETYEKYKDKK